MDFDQYPHRTCSFFTIDPTSYLSTNYILTRSLQSHLPLYYPFTWYVHDNQAINVNVNDIQQQPQRTFGAYDDEVLILNDIGTDQIDDSFQQLSMSSMHTDETLIVEEGYEYLRNSRRDTRLNKRVIAENLKVTNYLEKEEEEICAICQVEFENNERVGVLQCGHRYHSICIKKWLVRKNVCPLCKGQGLKV